MTNKISVKISQEIINKIKRKVYESQGQFRSIDEYIEFILIEILKEQNEIELQFTSEEEKIIKERLKKLGYI